MRADPPRILPFPDAAVSSPRRAVIVTSYITGAPNGRNVGVAGYSYDMVVRLFAPLIEQWGELIVVPRQEVDRAVEEARARNLAPIHVSFLPFQDVRLAQDAPNVVVPAWEYPDIPDHEFDDNPQNNWVATAARCDLVVVGGPFTVETFRRGGVATPIRIVQVPTPDDYFRAPSWQPDHRTTLTCSAQVFSCPDAVHTPCVGAVSQPAEPVLPLRQKRARLLAAAARALYKHGVRRVVSERLGDAVAVAAYAGMESWRSARRLSALRGSAASALGLSGVVYTSIFNSIDGRKNWEDLLTGFLWALKDCEDATLVLKLITNRQKVVDEVWSSYRRSGIPHRCKVALISDFLTEEQLIDLVGPTTYYITTTRAEGNCLPLMNYLAAGRPSISPCHTAIADYFDRDVGFVVESHPEPTAFPHDRGFRRTTTWHRLVWTSLVEQIQRSYEVAKQDLPTYRRLARNARERMRGWSSPQAVAPRLHEALDVVAQAGSQQPRLEEGHWRRRAA